MKKTIRLGVNRDRISVFCKIEFSKGRLSISGVEGPMSSGNCKGGCGQIVMNLDVDEITPAPGWTTKDISKFLVLWRRWHLNDLKAGTPAQEAYLRKHKDEYPGYPVSHYDWAKEVLEKAELHPDPETSYKYGSAWLKEAVPQNVTDWLFARPDTDIIPAWV